MFVFFLQDESYLTSNQKCHKTKENVLKIDDFEHNTCSYVHMNGICDDFANTEGNSTNLKYDSFQKKIHSNN